jgi:murein L,D-transpeptidase YcbB/YkuD
MFSRIVRDPGYLVRNGYKVFQKGEEINPFTVNWRRYGPGRIPYSIRQEPGDDNSLGKIKFTFRNAFSIYMHDTPLKSKFKLNNRAVSHGCVRLADPAALAEFVMQRNERVRNDDLRMMMGQAPKDSLRKVQWEEDTLLQQKKIVKTTRAIPVEKGMTVYFDYKTIVFDEMDRPQFIFDCYDKNRAIIEAINKP